jgi:hypothetical protein
MQFLHMYCPQDGRVNWVNDLNRNTITKICFIKMVVTANVAMQKTILTGIKHETLCNLPHGSSHS